MVYTHYIDVDFAIKGYVFFHNGGAESEWSNRIFRALLAVLGYGILVHHCLFPLLCSGMLFSVGLVVVLPEDS